MKATKGENSSEFIVEQDNGYIYRSVTPYDEYADYVEYSVVGPNGKDLGRFYDIAEASNAFYNQYL